MLSVGRGDLFGETGVAAVVAVVGLATGAAAAASDEEDVVLPTQAQATITHMNAYGCVPPRALVWAPRPRTLPLRDTNEPPAPPVLGHPATTLDMPPHRMSRRSSALSTKSALMMAPLQTGSDQAR